MTEFGICTHASPDGRVKAVPFFLRHLAVPLKRPTQGASFCIEDLGLGSGFVAGATLAEEQAWETNGEAFTDFRSTWFEMALPDADTEARALGLSGTDSGSGEPSEDPAAAGDETDGGADGTETGADFGFETTAWGGDFFLVGLFFLMRRGGPWRGRRAELRRRDRRRTRWEKADTLSPCWERLHLYLQR